MAGRFGKYGDMKRRAKIRQSRRAAIKARKLKPDTHRPLRQPKKRSD